MCTAITELIEDGRKEGLRLGRDEGLRLGRKEGLRDGRNEGLQLGRDDKTRAVVRNMILRGMPDADIMAVAECSQELVDEVRKKC